MSEKKRIDVSGGNDLGQNPFGGLDSAGLPPVPEPSGEQPAKRRRGGEKKPGRRGRVDICRERSGRGGKLVTVVSGFQGVSSRELEEWARDLRKRCGVGGACKDRKVELQGDHREAARAYFEERGFRPVFVGG